MIAGARTLAIMLIGVSATVSPGLADRSPWLIWNASASVPIGLYAIHTVGALRVGDLVVATAARAARELPRRPRLPAAWRAAREACGGAPRTVRLPQRAQGQRRRRCGRRGARARQSRTVRCPLWQGCRVIAVGEVFLMNALSADSLDGRYFGPLPAASIVGRAAPLWTHRTAEEK